MGRQVEEGMEEESPLVRRGKGAEGRGRSGADGTVASTVLLQISDVVGVGFLALPSAFAQLGWGLGLATVVAMCPLNLYAGHLVWQAAALEPEARNYMDLARATTGGAGVVAAVYASYIAMTLSSYLIMQTRVLAALLGGEDEDSDSWCEPTLGAALCLQLLPLVQQRSLNASKALLWANASLIGAVVAASLGYMAVALGAGHEPPLPTEWVSSRLDWASASQALSTQAFAYLGCYIYLEMIREMKHPGRFPATLAISGPVQVATYALCGGMGYAYFGAASSRTVVEAIPREQPLLFSLASLSLLAYLNVAYLVKATALTRAAHAALCPRTLDARSREASAHWLALSSALLGGCYVFANAVPSFSDAVGLLGSVQSPVLGYILPVLFLQAARRKLGVPTSWLEALAFKALLTFGVVLGVVGTAANLASIGSSFASGSRPFDCHPLF